MKKILISIILLLLLVPTIISAKNDDLKAAFIRNDDLWIIQGEKEVKVTNGEYIRHPRWSIDGSWIAYLKGTKKVDFPLFNGELWLYNLKTNKHFKVKDNVNNHFQWSPNPKQNTISFQVNKALYSLNTNQLNQSQAIPIALGIENFSWLPGGNGLLISTKVSEKLGSDLILSKITFKRNKPTINRFYTIPVGTDEYYVSTSEFKWSNDKKWLSFLLVPTASLSADGNTLCVLSSDGKVFQKVDEMLNYQEWIHWSPYKSLLGYISGAGREVATNKQFRVIDVPSLNKQLFTPKGYADRDFTWHNSRSLYVSRSKETDMDHLKKNPLPSLYKINLKTDKQTRLTTPLNNKGDFEPQIVRNNLIWVRTDSQTANVLVTPTYQFKEKLWIKNISISSSYYNKWNWDEVLSLYKTQSAR